jgi:hypothetical protein
MPASQLRDGLGAGVDRWFSRAMHREAAQRFQSAREMAREFVNLVAGQTALLDELAGDETPPPAQLTEAARQVVVTPGTLSGSASNLSTPSRIRRRRMASLVRASVALAVLTVVAVVTIVSLRGGGAQPEEAFSAAPPTAEAPAAIPEPLEEQLEPPPEPSATPSTEPAPSASASAITAPPPVPKWTPQPPPPPPTAEPTEPTPGDHGF